MNKKKTDTSVDGKIFSFKQLPGQNQMECISGTAA